MALARGQQIANTGAGTDTTALAKALRELVGRDRRRKRGRRLEPSAVRDALPAEVGVAYPTTEATGLGGGSGLVSPVEEQPYIGTNYFMLTDSTGIITLEYPEETKFIDAVGTEEVRKWLAP